MRTLVVALSLQVAALAACVWFPSLWPIAIFCFMQNVAFTFVSRGRNSGSLVYHLVAAVFSNGIYAGLLLLSIDLISGSRAAPVPFWAIYTASTLSGSVFAHWLALKVERGKGRNVQEDGLTRLARRVEALERDKWR